MVARQKISDAQRLELMAIHSAGLIKEARQYAVELGVTKYYAQIMIKRLIHGRRKNYRNLKLQRITQSDHHRS